MRFFHFYLLIFFTTAFSSNIENWVVDYSKDASINKLKQYQLIVLDSQNHPDIDLVKTKNNIVLGYISLGEIENIRPYFQQAKDAGYLLQENKNWPGSYYVDVRQPQWAKLVIDKLIPSILNQEFDGIFIDTMDNPEYLEEIEPKKYRGMKKAGINLIKLIRLNYPHIKIMMNRGFLLLPYVADDIDYELAESLMTDINFKDNSYNMRPKNVYLETIKTLKSIQNTHPKLLLFSLDYWNPKDIKEVKSIYQTERNHGFIPYVSTLELNKIYPEPK